MSQTSKDLAKAKHLHSKKQNRKHKHKKPGLQQPTTASHQQKNQPPKPPKQKRVYEIRDDSEEEEDNEEGAEGQESQGGGEEKGKAEGSTADATGKTQTSSPASSTKNEGDIKRASIQELLRSNEQLVSGQAQKQGFHFRGEEKWWQTSSSIADTHLSWMKTGSFFLFDPHSSALPLRQLSSLSPSFKPPPVSLQIQQPSTQSPISSTLVSSSSASSSASSSSPSTSSSSSSSKPSPLPQSSSTDSKTTTDSKVTTDKTEQDDLDMLDELLGGAGADPISPTQASIPSFQPELTTKPVVPSKASATGSGTTSSLVSPSTASALQKELDQREQDNIDDWLGSLLGAEAPNTTSPAAKNPPVTSSTLPSPSVPVAPLPSSTFTPTTKQPHGTAGQQQEKKQDDEISGWLDSLLDEETSSSSSPSSSSSLSLSSLIVTGSDGKSGVQKEGSNSQPSSAPSSSSSSISTTTSSTSSAAPASSPPPAFQGTTKDEGASGENIDAWLDSLLE